MCSGLRFWEGTGFREPVADGPGLDGFRQVFGAVPKVLGGRSSEVAGSGGSESCLVPGFDWFWQVPGFSGNSVPEVGKDLCGFEGSGFRWVPTGSEVLEIPLARFGKLPRFPKFHWFRLSRGTNQVPNLLFRNVIDHSILKSIDPFL